MLVMAEKDETTGKKKRGRPKQDGPKRPGVPLHVWITPELRDAIDLACSRNRRILRDEVSLALETYLRGLGLWPPIPPSPPDPS